MAIAIICANKDRSQDINTLCGGGKPWPYRVYSAQDCWSDTYIMEHVVPYYGDSALETWINDEDPIYGDIGASQD